MEVLHAKNVEGAKNEWDASPESIKATAEWLFPILERFIRGVNGMANGYVIEGVDFLPAQIAELSKSYQIHSVFLGRSKMSLKIFDQYLGKSKGYANLPREIRSQFAKDVPMWSKIIKQEAKRFNCPYIDMGNDFQFQLKEAETIITATK